MSRRRTRHTLRDHSRKLTLQPAFQCDIVERPHDLRQSHFGSREIPKGSRTAQAKRRRAVEHFHHVKNEPSIVHRINDERRLRTLKQEYKQCTCGLRDELLRPMGQVLKFTTGLTDTGRMPESDGESRTVFMPLQLMSATQKKKYSSIKNAVCWWCSYPVIGSVVGCPISHRRIEHPTTRKKVDGFYFIGYFCSWPCARAYGNLFHHDIDELGQYFYAVLLFVVRNLRKEGRLDQTFRVPHVRPALHFSVLEKFDGPMTIEEFRRSTEIDNSLELTVVPNWMPIVPAGMRATETPCVPRRFADEFNLSVVFDEPVRPEPPPERRTVRARRGSLATNAATIRRATKNARAGRVAVARAPSRHPSTNQIGVNQLPTVNPIQMALSRRS